MFSVMEWRWRECAGSDSELSRNRIPLRELCPDPCCVIIVRLLSRLFTVELMELGRLCRARNCWEVLGASASSAVEVIRMRGGEGKCRWEDNYVDPSMQTLPYGPEVQ